MGTDPPRILVLLKPGLYADVFTPPADALLRSLGPVTFRREDEGLGERDLPARVAGFEVAVTGWGTPRFTAEVLDAAPRLRLIAHVGGTVRGLVSDAVFERGVAVVNAGHAMVPAVAEFTLLLILTCLRRPASMDRRLKAGEAWSAVRSDSRGGELAGRAVGVVGAGQIGRRVIALLRAFEARVLVCDPCLAADAAEALGATPAGLGELLSACSVVTLHAPALPSTRGMIGARELALLPDGAWLVNTARSWLTDEAALLEELRTGRIGAALDVLDAEPLPEESPFRGLDNAIVTPHAAFMTRECFARFGEGIAAEIGRFVRGEPLRHRVTADMLATMA